jgi:hypothetical protein
MLTRNHQTCKSRLCPAWTTFALLPLVLLGCTTVETNSFNVIQSDNVDSVYIATNADFSKYSQLLADDLGIFFPQDSYTSAEDVRRIRQIFRSAFINELEGYSIVNTPGPSTMKVKASLIDLRNDVGPGTLSSLSREVRDIASTGKLLFIMEMRDSDTDAILARAADSARTPTFATSESDATDWSSVEAAAQHWAALFRTFLDENFAH